MDDEAPMRRNPLITALLLAGALALGGCGDDPAAEGMAAFFDKRPARFH